MNFMFWPSWPELPHLPTLISRLTVSPSFFTKSFAPDGALRTRICDLRKTANRMGRLLQAVARNRARFFRSTRAREIQAIRDEDSANERRTRRSALAGIRLHSSDRSCRDEYRIRGLAGGRREGSDPVLTDRVPLVEFQVHLRARTHNESGRSGTRSQVSTSTAQLRLH